MAGWIRGILFPHCLVTLNMVLMAQIFIRTLSLPPISYLFSADATHKVHGIFT